MRRAIFLCMAGAALASCAPDRIVAKPAAPPPASTPAPEGPKLQMVGTTNISAYAIPVYPEAKVEDDASSVDAKNHVVKITLETFAPVPDLAVWYRDQIKATAAQSSPNLGAIEGTTKTGYPISVTIADIGSKSVIRITVTTNQKK
jgi:hypothetical protein